MNTTSVNHRPSTNNSHYDAQPQCQSQCKCEVYPKAHPKRNQKQKQKQKRSSLSLIETIMVLAGGFCIVIMIVQLHLHNDLHDKHSSLRHHNDNDDDGISGLVDLNRNDDHYDTNSHDNHNNRNNNDNNNADLLFHNGYDGNGNGNSYVDDDKDKDGGGDRIISDNTDGADNTDSNNNDKNKSSQEQEQIQPTTESSLSAAEKSSSSSLSSNNPPKKIKDCGCPSTCTEEALQISNSHFKCKARIQKLMSSYKSTELQACAASSKSSMDDMDEDQMRPCPLYCHPDVCHTMTESTVQELKLKDTLKETKKGIDCGCPKTCTKRALQKRNPNFVCHERITHLMTKYDIPEVEACEAASQDEFVYTTGDMAKVDKNSNKPCEYECHPKLCHSTKVPDEVIATMNLPKSFTANTNVTATNTTTKDTTNIKTSSSSSSFSSFHKYDKVVIVTKVLSSKNINTLIQMLCLFHAAYNRFVQYDIIVFTTLPFTHDEIQLVQDIVTPSHVQIIPEGPSLEDHLNNMTIQERTDLYQRCNVQHNETSITWLHHCSEKNSKHVFNLGYAWQAEFRSYHLWTHDALVEYDYMMWLDADAMCTKTWEVDPMRIMVENDLILMFDQFPGGYVRGEVLRQKMEAAYVSASDGGTIGNDRNGTGVICKVDLDEERGVLTREFCRDDGKKRSLPSIRQVYGFHHITNLNVYRQKNHQQFLKGLISNDYKFSRLWDDQLAVTLPAVMEDPERCWDYRLNGLNMGIHHNGRIDGKEHPEYLSYVSFWAHHGKYDWPAARAMCDGLVTSIG